MPAASCEGVLEVTKKEKCLNSAHKEFEEPVWPDEDD